MHHLLCLCLVALLAITARAQTATVVDGAGNTIVQVVTTDADGDPTTSIIQTLPPAVPPPATSAATTAPTLPAPVPPTTTTPPTPPTAITQPQTQIANTPPPVQQGPVGQPDATKFTPGGPTPFTYTTIIGGETSVIVDTFVPTNPATRPPSVGPPGTILNYSQWAAQYGPQSSASGTANAAYGPPALAAGWWGFLASCGIAVMGGLGLAML
ncbi:hypothetical protein FPV67DRAFT_1469577 [Lyophyllum atratum]|nr:hypothetical protein FPV67DRAFT_1469577 [Lyophyllum atratum]